MTTFHNTDKNVSYCDYFVLLSAITENEVGCEEKCGASLTFT